MGARGTRRTRRSSTCHRPGGSAPPDRFDVKELPWHCNWKLSPDQSRAPLCTRDLTDPTEGAHGMQRIVDDIVAVLVVLRGGRRIHRGARIVDCGARTTTPSATKPTR